MHHPVEAHLGWGEESAQRGVGAGRPTRRSASSREMVAGPVGDEEVEASAAVAAARHARRFDNEENEEGDERIR